MKISTEKIAMLALVAFSPFALLKAQVQPGTGQTPSDTARKTKVSKVEKEDKEHQNYRDTFNEHNKNKGGEAKDKKVKSEKKSKKKVKSADKVKVKDNHPEGDDKKGDDKKKDKKEKDKEENKGTGKTMSKQARIRGNAPALNHS
ncbi:MAG: hypothetical protein KG003_11570 [Bacteroidetes bacterium]|nr:hypothetical protein [Bacteroidota bacterium]